MALTVQEFLGRSTIMECLWDHFVNQAWMLQITILDEATSTHPQYKNCDMNIACLWVHKIHIQT